jgi:eukaryotic-like serine/threonine-protein kinase
LPFRANTAWEWATQHMTVAPIPLESMTEGMRAPEAMRAAIRRALAKAPNERFQTMREFGNAFASASTSPATAAVPVQGAGGRARTELGAPLDVAAAFGASSGGTPAAPSGGQQPQGYGAQGYTPVGGNVAFPTPAGIPQPPPRDGARGGGGGRTVLLASAGLIGVASVVAIVFAMRGTGHGGAVMFDGGDLPSAPPATTLTAEPSVASASAPPLESAGIPGLNAGGGGSPRPQPHPQPSHEPSSSPAAPSAPPTPTTTAPKKYDGPECQTARRFKAMGRLKEAQSYILACLAKGGDPN